MDGTHEEQLAQAVQRLEEIRAQYGYRRDLWISPYLNDRVDPMRSRKTRTIAFPGTYDYAEEYHYRTPDGERFVYGMFLQADIGEHYIPRYIFTRVVPDAVLPDLLREIRRYEHLLLQQKLGT